MKLVNLNVDKMQMFVMINNVEIMINADVKVKNWLAKVDVIMDLFGILVHVIMNVKNHVMLENI